MRLKTALLIYYLTLTSIICSVLWKQEYRLGMGVFGWIVHSKVIEVASAAPNDTTGLEFKPISSGVIVFNSETIDTIITNDQPQACFTFDFTNISLKNVTITEVNTSCGCTTAKLPSLPWTIAPGRMGEIPITMKINGRTGQIPKSVTIRTLQGFKVLTVVAQVRPSLMVEDMAERENNQSLAKADRQMVFKGDCAICHADRAKGKWGQELYLAACGICHDASPRASMVPNLNAINHPTDYNYWKLIIANGKPGTLMPAFAADQGGPLTDLQIESLAVFLTNAISADAR